VVLAFGIQDFVRRAGYPGLFALIVAENLFPPIPSEVILPFAGYQVQQGALHFLGARAAARAGSVVGALILYEIAHRGGRPLILRHGRFLRVDAAVLERSERRFDRYGTAIVLGGRLVPGVRSVVSLPAGLVGMPVGRFTFLTAIGSLAWNAILIGGGWALGAQYGRVADAVGPASKAAVVVLVLCGLGGYGLWRRRRARG